MVRVTYYLEVLSSWCYWAEPAWAELKRRYAGQVEFGWKIALMPAEAFPVSREQCEWFYRRSGSIMRSPFMLNPGWFDSGTNQRYLPPNYLAEAAKDFGVVDDRVRLALSHAAVREGKKVGRWEVALPVAAEAAKMDSATLLERAQAAEIARRCESSTREFQNLQINQRPAFLIESGIGDRAVFSGIARAEPLAAAIDALLQDALAYRSWESHFGGPPQK